jgi:putative transposase
MVSVPFADFTWRHARRLTAQTGRDDTNETEVARVLDDLLTRAQAGPPVDKASARIAARTRVAAAAHRPPPAEVAADAEEDQSDEVETASVIPMGIFDARAEAERWPY